MLGAIGHECRDDAEGIKDTGGWARVRSVKFCGILEKIVRRGAGKVHFCKFQVILHLSCVLRARK